MPPACSCGAAPSITDSPIGVDGQQVDRVGRRGGGRDGASAARSCAPAHRRRRGACGGRRVGSVLLSAGVDGLLALLAVALDLADAEHVRGGDADVGEPDEQREPPTPTTTARRRRWRASVVRGRRSPRNALAETTLADRQFDEAVAGLGDGHRDEHRDEELAAA